MPTRAGRELFLRAQAAGEDGASCCPPVAVAACGGARGACEGLFAAQHLRRGRCIFTERALHSFRVPDGSGLPTCAHCQRGLATAEEALGAADAARLPLPERWPRRAGCSAACEACGALFCSPPCLRAARRTHHARLCGGALGELAAHGARATYGAAATLPLLGARVVAELLVERQAALERLGGGGEAGEEARQALPPPLESASIASFCGAEGLAGEGEDYFDAAGHERWYEWTCRALRLAPAERAWLPFAAYADLMRRVACNTIRLTPRSPFTAYFSAMRRAKRPGSDGCEAAVGEVLALAESRHGGNATAAGDECGAAKGATGLRAASAALEASCATAAGAMFTLACKINHACEPNVAVHSFTFDDATVDVVALRDIRAGEELHISYVDPSLPRGTRRKLLREQYSFECDCERCVCEAGT